MSEKDHNGEADKGAEGMIMIIDDDVMIYR